VKVAQRTGLKKRRKKMEEAMGDHALQRCHDEMMNLSQPVTESSDDAR
jgi:hypothetical protein